MHHALTCRIPSFSTISPTVTGPGTSSRLGRRLDEGFGGGEFGTLARPTVSRDVAEMCLGHKIYKGVEAVYARSDLLDLRRVALQRWADYLTGEREAVALSEVA